MKMRRVFESLGLAVGCCAIVCAQSTQPSLQNKTAEPAAQRSAAPTSALTVDAKLVVVPVAVRDKKGVLVKGLTKDDFSLQTGGKDVAIRYFDTDNNQPLTLGLLVDVSRSQTNVLPEERKAAQAFLDAMVQPASAGRAADKAFVLHFAHDIELLQDVTIDRARLDKAIGELGTESPTFHTATDQGTMDSEHRMVHGHGTSLYDAVFLAGNDILKTQTGRKAMVVLTDGVDMGSKESLTEAIEAAQRANVAVYAVFFRGNERPQQNYPQHRSGYPGSGYPGGYPGNYPGRYPGNNPNDPNNPNNPNNPNSPNYDPNSPNNPNNPNSPNYDPNNPNPNYPNPNNRPAGGTTRRSGVDGKQVLERLCGETGGRVFEVSRKQSVQDIFAQISEELRTQYLLGFSPDGTAAKSGYHQLDLRMTGAYKGKDMDVQARDGYYVESKD
jgi:VWFA-related protein